MSNDASPRCLKLHRFGTVVQELFENLWGDIFGLQARRCLLKGDRKPMASCPKATAFDRSAGKLESNKV